MRLYQLTENTVDGIEEIYDALMRDCQPFYELSKGFRKVPLRNMGNMDLPHNFFDDAVMEKVDNRPIRTPISYNKSTNSIVSNTIEELGHASRTKFMMSASSKGKNPVFKVNINDAARVFPIGDFNYSYVKDDYNVAMLIPRFEALYNQILSNPDLPNTFKDDFKSIKTIYDFIDVYKKLAYQEGEDENMEKGEIESIIHEDLEAVYILLNDINKIHSDDYVSAFKEENEIWFNCKSYYALSNKTYIELGKYITK